MSHLASTGGLPPSDADALFVLHAREDILALVARIRELEDR